MRGDLFGAHIPRTRIGLHYTWVIAFGLIIVIVATQLPETYSLWIRLLLGVMASLLFLVAVVIRQLVINFVASRRRIRFNHVTLFVFGGVPGIARVSTLPVLELLLAIVGLISGLILVVLFYAAYTMLVIYGSTMIAGVIQWLTFIILMLTLFDFIPGFPLDAGRVFRAALWKATADYDRATLIASWIGQGIGLLFIAGGIALMIIAQQWFTGLVLAFVGWGLESAAAQSRRQTVFRQALRGIIVADVMSKENTYISSNLTLEQLLRDYILVTGQRHFAVVDAAKLQGIVTIHDLKSMSKKRWKSTRVEEIMTSTNRLEIAHTDQSAADLIEQMNELRIGVMPVLEGDKLVGVLLRDSLLQLARTRAEFRI
jgi:CBS domain-containing protein